jgi:DNA (cytosine-5)-methyltransferase 1
MYKHLDLFSGIGGFSLGLEATGEFETVAFCDYEPFCQKVLRKHWEEVPIYGDIKELTYEKLRADGIDKIDIITGGYPCQPFSVAGNKKGEQDPRHLWPEYFRLVKECRPTWVIGENVGGHIKLGLDTVLKDLESEGYSTRTFSISAASIGANHKRERVWIVAHSNDRLSNGKNEEVRTGRNTFNNGSSDLANSTTHRSFNESKRNFGSLGEESKEKERGRDQSTIRTETCSTEMGNSDNKRQQEQWNPESIPETIKRETERSSTERSRWWDVEPNVGRVVDGIPKRVDRLKSLGNSLIPQIPYYIGQSIIKSGEIK